MKSIAQTKVALVSLVLVFSLVAYGHRVSPFPILPNSSVFIDPMDGFGHELQKAFLKDGVPLVIVSDKKTADFEIMGGIQDGQEPTSTGSMTWGESGEQQADVYEPRPRLITVTIVSLQTGDLAWGYGMSGMTDLRACSGFLREAAKKQDKAWALSPVHRIMQQRGDRFVFFATGLQHQRRYAK
jgi:hypothetical protein